MPLLIEIHGKDWKLEVIGKLPALPSFIHLSPNTCVSLSGDASLYTLNRNSNILMPTIPGKNIDPLLFEGVIYDFHFEKSSSAILKLPFGAEPRRIRQDSEHHVLSFQNNVGFIDIEVLDGKEKVIIQLEVFSRKIDYRTDYIQMRDEVSKILRNLAMTASAKTYGLAAPDKRYRPTLTEWFAVVKENFEKFIQLTTTISKNPHSTLKLKKVERLTDKARKISRNTLSQSLRKSGDGPLIQSLGIALPKKIHEDISFSTFDTAENRYYKGLLETTYRNVRALSRLSRSEDEDAESELEKRFFISIKPSLKIMERKIEIALKAPFLANVGKSSLQRPSSLVFHKNPTYARIDKMARLFNSGLSFTGNIIPIAVKDTALLYEYWCFLKIVDLLRENFDLEEQTIVKVNRFRSTVTLAKGVSAAMRFKHTATGKTLYVIYNRMFNRLPTISQKPDNVIQLATDGKFYIFDAKYRLQFDSDYIHQYGGAGPTTDDINTMHRYRDAIAIPHPLKPNTYLKGVVLGAVTLFPLPNEEDYQSHKFYKSISQVEIGGIPFLPNTTKLMKEKLFSIMASQVDFDPNTQ